jgi:hypothetical protein
VDSDRAERDYTEGYNLLATLALAVQALKELATRNDEHQATIQEQQKTDQ